MFKHGGASPCNMKKLILLAFVLGSSIGSYAQLNGNGYYRVKNAKTNEYAMLVSNELNYDACIGEDGGLTNLLKDTDCKWLIFFPISDGTAYYITDSKTNGAFASLVEQINCYLQQDIHLDASAGKSASSIFYIKQSAGSSYDLYAQGTNLYKITTGVYTGSKHLGDINIGGFYSTISNISGSNAYNIYMPISMKGGGHTYDAGTYYFTDASGKFKIVRDGNKSDNKNVEEAEWTLELATTFNVKPLSKVKDAQGHYWTTLCVDFPFSIPTGSTVLAAYTVTGKTNDNKVVLNKLSGTIAGGTPVLLECSSAEENKNILNIETGTTPAGKDCATGAYVSGSDDNYLKGRYFNAAAKKYDYKYYYNGNGGTNNVKNPETKSINTTGNFLTNNQNDFRVLNVNKDGVIGFYKLKAGASMGANKAFLNIKGLPTVTTATAKVFAVEGINETTGIDAVKNKAAHPDIVYDLQGRRVNAPASHGIYIVNGKKVVF